VLTINAGSSSIKYAVFEGPVRRLEGVVDRIGLQGTTLRSRDCASDERSESAMAAADLPAAASALLAWLDGHVGIATLVAIGHRVVHGMDRSGPEVVTSALLADLHRIEAFAPDHLPAELRLIEAFRDADAHRLQVACFDTAFHRSMPRVAQRLSIPRRYEAQGLRRYGFHGLSLAYLMAALERLAGPQAARGRTIVAHLGNGASLTAVHEGRSIDTSMGFTPAGGLPMGTRAGDLDPAIGPFLHRSEQMAPAAFAAMVNEASGLLGVSETSSDMRDLLEREHADPRAAEAVALFCYQAKKWVGAYAAALGGLQTLVFSGGIGENAAPVRARICDGLGFLGIELCPARNAAAADVVSSDASRVTVRVIRTDEESVIAAATQRLLALRTDPPDPARRGA
jgi:acetate kinase